MKKNNEGDEKNKQKNIAANSFFFISWNKFVFYLNVFCYLPKLTVFSEIGNNLMRALGRKKHMFFFGNALPKSNARANLKQRKNIVTIRLRDQDNNTSSLRLSPVSSTAVTQGAYSDVLQKPGEWQQINRRKNIKSKIKGHDIVLNLKGIKNGRSVTLYVRNIPVCDNETMKHNNVYHCKWKVMWSLRGKIKTIV